MSTDDTQKARTKHDFEHDLRKLVDRYRDEADAEDRTLALVTDAVRAELEHGNYQGAHGQ